MPALLPPSRHSQVIPLCYAWFFPGREDYAEHATKLLRTWFLDPAKRMNPHLTYAQGTGRGGGTMATRRFGPRSPGMRQHFQHGHETFFHALVRKKRLHWQGQDSHGLVGWSMHGLVGIIFSSKKRCHSTSHLGAKSFQAAVRSCIVQVSPDSVTAAATASWIPLGCQSWWMQWGC